MAASQTQYLPHIGLHSAGSSEARPRLGSPLIRMGEVTSTMDIARQLESLGAADGTAIIASHQTAGRGRSGRQWQSPANAGFYCSVLLRPGIPVDRFQPFALASGLALCDALDPAQELGIQVKWPNDLLYRDHKLAGILLTSSLQSERVSFAVLGTGINLLPDATRPEGATSLSEIDETHPTDVASISDSIFTSLSVRYRQILHGDHASALAGWQVRLAFLNRDVTLLDGSESIHGSVAGIDDMGALLLDTASGRRTITAGELTRGPRPIE